MSVYLFMFGMYMYDRKVLFLEIDCLLKVPLGPEFWYSIFLHF